MRDERSRAAEDRRQRRAELVRGSRDEVRARALEDVAASVASRTASTLPPSNTLSAGESQRSEPLISTGTKPSWRCAAVGEALVVRHDGRGLPPDRRIARRRRRAAPPAPFQKRIRPGVVDQEDGVGHVRESAGGIGSLLRPSRASSSDA